MPQKATPEARARKAAYDKIYKAKNKAKILAQAAAYRKANPEKVRKANPEKVRKAVRSAWAKNSEKYNATARAKKNWKKPERMAVGKAWVSNNREKRRAIGRRWNAKNRERNNEYGRLWKASNRDKCKIYKRRRRARVLGCEAHHTEQEWLAVLAAHGGKCVYCGTGGTKKNHITRDHIVALSRGGSDTVENLVPACKSCNGRKHARDHIRFVQQEFGRLL